MTPYVYNATVVTVHDGDTLDAAVDLGFGLSLRRLPIRLAGCNAAELHTPGGDAAAANLIALLPAGTPITLSTVRADKYQRWDAHITLADGTDLVAKLIAYHWLAPWNGSGARPIPPWPRP